MRTVGPSDSRLASRLSLLLLVGVSLAVALFVTGAVLAAIKPELPVSPSSIPGLPGSLVALEPVGFFDLGLIVLVATPAARVAALLIAFARRREWLFSGLSLMVLFVLALSAFLGLRGG